MLSQLLKISTPDLILQAIKDNPTVVLEVLQRFDTFRLLGQSLTPDLQVVLSNNGRLVNEYLASEDGKAAARLWAEGFSEFVLLSKKASQTLAAKVTDTQDNLELKIRKELEIKIRAELEEKIRKELSDKKQIS